MTDPITNLPIPDTGYFAWAGATLKDWIKTRVTSDFVVATEVPSPRPTRLIVCKSATTGEGAYWNVTLSWRRLIVHNYDKTESLVMREAEMVRGYIIDGMFERGSGYRGVRIVGEPMYFPDPDDPAKTPRGQQTVDLLLRARFAPYPAS
jgi:hypothetical protein